MWIVFFTGFLTSFALIAAIGAQNAFVLRQGIRREHVMPVVAVCTVSDIALIAAGVGGVRAPLAADPRGARASPSRGRRFPHRLWPARGWAGDPAKLAESVGDRAGPPDRRARDLPGADLPQPA